MSRPTVPSASVEETKVKSPLVGENCIFILQATFASKAECPLHECLYSIVWSLWKILIIKQLKYLIDISFSYAEIIPFCPWNDVSEEVRQYKNNHGRRETGSPEKAGKDDTSHPMQQPNAYPLAATACDCYIESSLRISRSGYKAQMIFGLVWRSTPNFIKQIATEREAQTVDVWSFSNSADKLYGEDLNSRQFGDKLH